MKFKDGEQKEFDNQMYELRKKIMSNKSQGFDEWLKTEHGKNCVSTFDGDPQYLRNRLWWAFEAGVKSGEEGHRLQKTIDWYEVRMKELKQRNARLVRELNKKEPTK